MKSWVQIAQLGSRCLSACIPLHTIRHGHSGLIQSSPLGWDRGLGQASRLVELREGPFHLQQANIRVLLTYHLLKCLKHRPGNRAVLQVQSYAMAGFSRSRPRASLALHGEPAVSPE